MCQGLDTILRKKNQQLQQITLKVEPKNAQNRGNVLRTQNDWIPKKKI